MGPDIAIFRRHDAPTSDARTPRATQCPTGVIGRVCVRGPLVCRGYLRDDDDDVKRDAFWAGDGWFDTGDLGRLDRDGTLCLTGRSKEVINRGGEILSPFEIENAMATHPGVRECAAVPAPHAELQECVALIMCSSPTGAVPGLRVLCAHAAASLHPSKWCVRLRCLVCHHACPSPRRIMHTCFSMARAGRVCW